MPHENDPSQEAPHIPYAQDELAVIVELPVTHRYPFNTKHGLVVVEHPTTLTIGPNELQMLNAARVRSGLALLSREELVHDTAESIARSEPVVAPQLPHTGGAFARLFHQLAEQPPVRYITVDDETIAAISDYSELLPRALELDAASH